MNSAESASPLESTRVAALQVPVSGGRVRSDLDTSCHTCGRTLVWRIGYRVLENKVLPSQECPDCGTLVAGRNMAG